MGRAQKQKARKAPFAGKHARAMRELQHDVLAAIASAMPLTDTMDLLCRRIADIVPKAICTVVRIDAQNRMQPLAAPALPDYYGAAIEGIHIGPSQGSCGTAAYRGEPVHVTDIANDPLWTNFKDLVLPLGLRACWSSPIKAHDGRVIGAFGFYARTPRGATKFERVVVDACVHLCAIAIEQWEAQERIRKLAFADPLTGLGNRAMLREHLPRLLSEAQAAGQSVGLFYIDLDGFKAINDLYGNSTGDNLLLQISGRLQGIGADTDMIIRLGGDEFLLIKSALASEAVFTELAEAITDNLRSWYAMDNGTGAAVSASVGISVFPLHGEDVDALMARADMALRSVKSLGGGQHKFFDAAMEAEKRERLDIERDIMTAVSGRQLAVAYQPQACVETGRVVGFEALLRWNHPEKGLISPAKFIPAAESCGMINAIGAFALVTACREAASWAEPLKIAVNVSPAQIVDGNFAQLLEKTLYETGLDPRRLEIEVTESLFIRDSDAALATLQHLKALGVSVAIDDFGTGYSSLSTLRSFPFDRLKVDRSFVFDMVGNADAAAIVNSVLGLGRAMGLPVVAEGVETNEQLELLRLLGCDEVQGYLIGRPNPISFYANLVAPPYTIDAEVSAA